MKAKITYYGMIAEQLGRSTEELTFVDSNPTDLREWFNAKYPKLEKLSYQIAVDNDLCETLEPHEGEINIALLPPFSGG